MLNLKDRKTKILIALSGIFILSATVISNRCLAQDGPTFKLKGGLNLTNFWISEVDDKNARVGFHAGGAMHYPITEHLGIQPELIYTTKGNTTSYEFLGVSGETTVNLDYLDVPIALVIHLGDYVDMQAGVYGGYLINASVTHAGDFGNDTDPIVEDEFKKLDYGLLGGIEMAGEKLGVGVRYNYGLQGIGSSDNSVDVYEDAKNSVLQGYIFLKLK